MPPRLARNALGLGLRTAHYREILEAWPTVDYFEIITENFLGDALPARYHLDQIKERYPLVLHGVGLNILGPEPPDLRYLDGVAWLADYVKAPFVSDHLCWTAAHGYSHHDLLPAPYLPELLELVAERAALAQRHLGRPFGLENLSSYVEFEQSSLNEWEFYAAAVARAGCHGNKTQTTTHKRNQQPRGFAKRGTHSRRSMTYIADALQVPARKLQFVQRYLRDCG